MTLTALEVTAAPFESVAFAVRETVAAAVGVQVTEFDEPDAGPTTVPTSVVPAKNSTLASVAVPTAVAVAVSVTAELTLTVEPAEGAVNETLGAVTLTLTAVEVTVTPLESVTRAVREVMPAAVGVHDIV
ncbi:MAG: hypothetical protein NTV51_00145 [Verrucomicrobia bacterium]|nr:hypothetical protein [Verrucomicrobiota bacterium]